MRLWGVVGGVAAYVLFAAGVDWLYRPDPRGVVALGSCAGADAAAAPAAVPFYWRLDAPRTIRLCAAFAGGHELLVLPRLAGNVLAVRIDGETRLTRGAVGRPANFWLQPQLVPLDGVGPGPHRLEVELHGLYDLGVRLPPYLTEWRSGGRRAGALVWLTSDFVALAAGLNLGVGLLLLAYGLRRRRQRLEALLFGAAAVAAILYVPDQVPGYGLLGPELFLIRRKISLVGAFLFGATIVGGLELSARVRRRWGPWLLGLASFFALVTLAAPDQVALKSVSTVGAWFYLPLSFYGTWLAARHLEPRYAWLWVFFGAALVHLTANLATGVGHLFLFHYGVLAAALAAGVRTTSQLAVMARELERTARAALTDPLTGARNRAFCDGLTLAPGDLVALVDFDGFKQVNDRHGHEAGDRLLIEFVRAARLCLRGTDHIVRMGGDEFLIVLRAAQPVAGRGVVEEILEAWRAAAPDLGPRASYGLVVAGDRHLEPALAAADRAMYESKSLAAGAAAPPRAPR